MTSNVLQDNEPFSMKNQLMLLSLNFALILYLIIESFILWVIVFRSLWL